MKPKRSFFAAAGCAAFLLAGASGWPQTAAGRLDLGIAAHNRAHAGDADALDQALDLLGPDGWARPAVALAYHGSALTLKAQAAKTEGKLMEALAFIDAGTKEMDDAVHLDPENWIVRVLRLENSLALIETSPINRKPQAREDIAALDARVDQLPPDTAAVVDLDRGRLALADRRLGEAQNAWRAALRRAPDSEAAARARKLLSRYGD